MGDCPRLQIGAVEFEDRLTTLENLREQCHALKQLLIPDDIWEQFKAYERLEKDEALLNSILIGSLLKGELHRVTSPCHRYLLDGHCVKLQVTKQYREDLKEHWMFEKDKMKRHNDSKGFQGKIVELQVAEWLESCEWQVVNLEALRGSFDIQAIQPNGTHGVIEVKFIGLDDEEFTQVVNALKVTRSGGPMPIPEASNYLVFRTYETSLTLKKSPDRRTAIIVVDDTAWMFFNMALRNQPIDWKQPRFLEAGPGWNAFIQKKKKEKRYSTIESDLAATINTLNELWILVRGKGQIYSRRFCHSFL
jgi:hypothetical protein